MIEKRLHGAGLSQKRKKANNKIKQKHVHDYNTTFKFVPEKTYTTILLQIILATTTACAYTYYTQFFQTGSVQFTKIMYYSI